MNTKFRAIAKCKLKRADYLTMAQAIKNLSIPYLPGNPFATLVSLPGLNRETLKGVYRILFYFILFYFILFYFILFKKSNKLPNCQSSISLPPLLFPLNFVACTERNNSPTHPYSTQIIFREKPEADMRIKNPQLPHSLIIRKKLMNSLTNQREPNCTSSNLSPATPQCSPVVLSLIPSHEENLKPDIFLMPPFQARVGCFLKQIGKTLPPLQYRTLIKKNNS